MTSGNEQRRQWFMVETGFHDGFGNSEAILFEDKSECANPELVTKVTELKPGEVIIDREKLRDLLWYYSSASYLGDSPETSGMIVNVNGVLNDLFGAEEES
jgi:hypothetical protein